MKSRHFVTPSPAESPVIKALRKAGFLTGSDDRMASFTCPMCQAIATYAVPSEQEPYGEVKCACGLSIIQQLEELGMELHEARCCPTLNISRVPIHEIVDAAEELLAETGKVVACGRSLYTADYRSGVLAWIDEADLTRLLPSLSKYFLIVNQECTETDKWVAPILSKRKIKSSEESFQKKSQSHRRTASMGLQKAVCTTG